MNGARKGVCGNYFHEMTLTELFTIHMNLHMMECLLIFGEKNFAEVPKICDIREIYDPQKKNALQYPLIEVCMCCTKLTSKVCVEECLQALVYTRDDPCIH